MFTTMLSVKGMLASDMSTSDVFKDYVEIVFGASITHE